MDKTLIIERLQVVVQELEREDKRKFRGLINSLVKIQDDIQNGR